MADVPQAYSLSDKLGSYWITFVRDFWFVIPLIILVLLYVYRKQVKEFLSQYENTKTKRKTFADKILKPSIYQIIGLISGLLVGILLILSNFYPVPEYFYQIIILSPFMMLSYMFGLPSEPKSILMVILIVFVWTMYGYLITSFITYLFNKYKKTFATVVFIIFCVLGCIVNWYSLAMSMY
jgi:hypothetical protein